MTASRSARMTGLRRNRVLLVAVAAHLAAAGTAACSGGAQSEAAIADREAPVARSESGPAAVQVVVPAGTALVVFGTDTVMAEVARTAAERAQGLMNRDEVPDGTGMLFVFEDVRVRTFWMKDTFVDLDIAFLDESYTIVDIQQMDAQSETQHESRRPALMALEVRRGWFAEHGIEVGATAEIFFGP